VSFNAMRRFALLAALLLLPPAAARAQEAQPDAGKKLRLVWDNRPSLRVGDDWFRMDLRIKLQGDRREFPAEVDLPGDTYVFGRRRVALEGRFLKHFEYQIERELRDRDPWRDVFVNFRYFRDAQVQAGKFKIPFSLEQTTGGFDLDFVYRSRAAENLAPARDIGAMVHGRVLGGGFGYEAGAFEHDGDQARFADNEGAGLTGAGRITVRPLEAIDSPLADLRVGIAVTVGDVPEGLNALRGRTVAGAPYFSDAYVKGRRVRLGTELRWELGPVSLKTEYVRVRDQRLEQGLLADDLSPLISQGGYVSATWVLTGESKSGGIDPKRPLLQGGVGAIELAARYERTQFGSDAPGEPAENNPRAANLLENGEDAWTAGVNWYVNRWVRIQANAIHERIRDIERSPVFEQNTFWTGVVRLQFVM
jgi:phosphate-selective porin OprO/OprP